MAIRRTPPEHPPLSLYVHFPWCVKKCPYCDFNSHEVTGAGFDEDGYVTALLRDLEMELPKIRQRRITSLFLGGGTPSLFSVTALDRLLTALRARLDFSADIEITLEANPGTVEAGRFNGYRAIGINRLSIGVQSFTDRHLRSLGRVHTARDALNAIELSRDAGFDNVNLDLMFGLPGQSVDEGLTDLKTALESAPAHVSWYQLTIEPNTVFGAKPPRLPADNETWELQDRGQALLAQQGFTQYEVSAYARDGYQCRHNLNYWEFGDYLGLGAGAHGKLTDAATGKVDRVKRHKLPVRYIELAGSEAVITGTRTLGRDDLVLEFMMNAMRLKDGVAGDLFLQRTGQPLQCMAPELARAEEQGLLDRRDTRLQSTDRGFRYLNDLLEIFVH